MVLSRRNMRQRDFSLHFLVLALVFLSSVVSLNFEDGIVSAVGDSGMRRDGLRVAIESWNQCNEVGEEAPNMGSPRAADCFDVYKASPQQGQFLSFFFLIEICHSVTWEKELGEGSWIFHHVLRTSVKYPWLMLYLRADSTTGFSGGYHYPTRGMLKIIPESPNFVVTFTLNVIRGGGPSSQFYLMDMGSCWKNNGLPCDGDVTSDVTRYSEMILNPDTPSWCHVDDFKLCPPFHTFSNGSRVHRNDTARFPYEAYHLYCAPGNAEHAETPNIMCDPYSNPQAQEILQILPHPVWGDYGYPTSKGEGWIGDPRTWVLNVGRMSGSLYFYQDPGTAPARRQWTSIDLGTEIFKAPNQVAEWTVSDFDIIVPNIY